MERERNGRIATIDGLRGIAILLVVWFHYWQISWQDAAIPLVGLSFQPLAETGFLGVALFFFISGFVITLPFVQARADGTARPSWRHFYTRRFLKIVPSYVLCIAVLIAIGFQTYPSVLTALRDVVFHLLFVHNWFAQTNESIDGPMWSLGVEVQFYLLFPLLCAAFLRWPRTTAVALFAVANAWRLWWFHANTYFIEELLAQLPGYLDFFAAGMLCAWAAVAIGRRPQLVARRWTFSALMLAGIAAYVALAHDCYVHRFDPGWPQLWVVHWRSAVALTCLATGLGSLFALRGLQHTLANPILIFLAAISYNLYLWHQPIARELVLHHIPPFTGDQHLDARWMLAFAFVAVPLALAVSTAITFGVERPILRWRRRKPLPATEGPEPRTAVTVAP